MDDYLRILKALADETRFKLVELLITHDLCVGALALKLGISAAAVSQHLKLLRDVGLVKGEKRGYWTHYGVDREKLRGLASSIEELLALSPCKESFCVKNECRKEEEKMCQCRCEFPERLKETPEKCTPEQIKECHGEEKHPCREEKEGTEEGGA